jgi:outer membrane protein assembly factor BamB
LSEIAPVGQSGDTPGRIVLNRLHSLNVCAADTDRIRWIKDLDSTTGVPSFASGVIYVGTESGSFYALADTDVLPPSSFVCSYPNIPSGLTCSSGGFRNVGVPVVVRQLSLSGSIPGIPAVSNGQVFVATTSGHLYGLVH